MSARENESERTVRVATMEQYVTQRQFQIRQHFVPSDFLVGLVKIFIQISFDI